MTVGEQLTLLQRNLRNASETTTFRDNMSLPVHRWFRFTAGFSADWLRDLLGDIDASDCANVLDPFCGSGTTPIEAALEGHHAIGIEAHPFIARIAIAKSKWRHDPEAFSKTARTVLETARRSATARRKHAPLILKCYPPETLKRLDALYLAWEETDADSETCGLLWLALASILRECSPVGTTQWQYILPNKRKILVRDPFEAFEKKTIAMATDMITVQSPESNGINKIEIGDARDCEVVDDGWADLVITSPPYANNYDYADATRLEMTFFGEIQSWGELQEAVRKFLVRSCTQHVASLVDQTMSIVDDPILEPISDELSETCIRLAHERESHGGKKNYHTMIATYFLDLAKVWSALRKKTSHDGQICFIIGDSAPYGVHVPVDRWLGELALSAGFSEYRFEKLRDRNVKWKNRKHRVPLVEGRLWVR